MRTPVSRQTDVRFSAGEPEVEFSGLRVSIGVSTRQVRASCEESLKVLQASNLLACSEVRLEGLEPPNLLIRSHKALPRGIGLNHEPGRTTRVRA